MAYIQFIKFTDWCRGIFVRKLFIIASVFMFLLAWAGDGYTRTTRSWNLKIIFVSEQFYNNGRWVDHTSPLRLEAGILKFSASAPGVSHNKARMRASKKAEKCTRDWWNRDCLAAQSTHYGREYRSHFWL